MDSLIFVPLVEAAVWVVLTSLMFDENILYIIISILKDRSSPNRTAIQG